MGNRPHYYAPACRPPCISIHVQSGGQSTHALLVPSRADRRRRKHASGCASNTIFGTKQINSPDARVILAACTAGVLKSAAKLAVVEVLHIADREQPHIVLRIIYYIMTEVRGHREAVKYESLDILQYVSPPQRCKDASQWPSIEAVGGERGISTGYRPMSGRLTLPLLNIHLAVRCARLHRHGQSSRC